MEQPIIFPSDGLALRGLIGTPPDLSPGERRPSIIIMHGFGGHKDGPQQRWSVETFLSMGYVTLRFDFRGCGESEGRRGFVLPEEQVSDARNAVTFLAARADVDPDRIAFSGTSYGATVAVYAAALDRHVSAVIAQGGWANGERMFRRLHEGDAAWRRFTDLLEQGRRYLEVTGESLYSHRFDLIPVPESQRQNIDARSIFEFPVDTALATMQFHPEDVVGEIAPRPLLLLHSANDEVIDASGSLEIFARARRPADVHVFSGVGHFMFGEDDPRVANVVRDWLAAYFPCSRP